MDRGIRTSFRAIYFEELTRRLPDHFEHDPRVSILTVCSGAWFWLRALVRGRFSARPAVRLNGVVGERRGAKQEELARIGRRFRGLRFTRGYSVLWASMGTVRDVKVHSVEPVILGAMTRGLWRGTEANLADVAESLDEFGGCPG